MLVWGLYIKSEKLSFGTLKETWTPFGKNKTAGCE